GVTLIDGDRGVVRGAGRLDVVDDQAEGGDGHRAGAIAVVAVDGDGGGVVGAVGRAERPAPGTVVVVDDGALRGGQADRVIARIEVGAGVGSGITLIDGDRGVVRGAGRRDVVDDQAEGGDGH